MTLTKEETELPFTQQEVEAAKATRDEIIANDISVQKGIYMAGKIVMWDEMQAQLKAERERAGKLMEALRGIAKYANAGKVLPTESYISELANRAINEYNKP